MSHDPVGRREFLGKSALAGTSLAVGTLASASAAASPNETIRVGVVGPGGRGTNLMRECAVRPTRDTLTRLSVSGLPTPTGAAVAWRMIRSSG